MKGSILRRIRELTPRRWTACFLGILLLGAGVAMNAKTRLGVAPVVSVAYSVAALTGTSFGVMTFLYYSFLILAQFLLLGKKFDHFQWIQIVTSFLTSAVIEIFDRLVPDAGAGWARVLMLLAAILLTGVGIILTVGARFVPNPADGTANAIAVRSGRSLGTSKNILDLSCILISLTLGLVFRGEVLGVGAGTVAAMLLTGRVVAWLQRPVFRLMGLA